MEKLNIFDFMAMRKCVTQTGVIKRKKKKKKPMWNDHSVIGPKVSSLGRSRCVYNCHTKVFQDLKGSDNFFICLRIVYC